MYLLIDITCSVFSVSKELSSIIYVVFTTEVVRVLLFCRKEKEA